MKTPLGWDPWYDNYLSYLLKVEHKAVGTVRDIRCTLKRVCGFMARHYADKSLWQLALQDYLIWLEEERQQETSETSLAKYLSHLRGLLAYCVHCSRCDRNVLDGFVLPVHGDLKKPRCLSIEEALRLVDACPSQIPTQRRERLVVLLLYGCGPRTDELSRLRMQDVDLERQELFIQGKGDKERIVPIPAAVYTELLAYLQQRGKGRGSLWHPGRRMNAHEVCRIVYEAASRAGFMGGVTPKVLRHSFATHLMERGVDLAVIASLMGHRGPQETGVYLHALGGETKAAVQSLDLGASS